MDEEIEHIGLGYFHYAAGLICGIGNASDAVELLAIGYVYTMYSVHVNAVLAAKDVAQPSIPPTHSPLGTSCRACQWTALKRGPSRQPCLLACLLAVLCVACLATV